VYYAYSEKCEVHSVGRVRLAFSTTKADLKKATCDDDKILTTSAADRSPSEIIELDSLRWQIETNHAHYVQRFTFSQEDKSAYIGNQGVIGSGAMVPATPA
jgi:hypothetical protein